jgi:hypothetical protein
MTRPLIKHFQRLVTSDWSLAIGHPPSAIGDPNKKIPAQDAGSI